MSQSWRVRRGPMAATVLGAHFTQVFNAAVRDKRLSRRARGLMVEILSHSDGFEISEAALLANGPEGRDAIRKALRELETCGYLRRVQGRGTAGKFVGTVFEITDMPEGLQLAVSAPWSPARENPRSEPLTEKPSTEGVGENPRSEPLTEKPSTDFPSTGNPQHKKNTPAGGSTPCGAEDSLSPSSHTRRGPGERESGSAPQDNPAGGQQTAGVPEQRDERGQEHAEAAGRVVEAYATAFGRPVLKDRRQELRGEAMRLLGAGYPEAWVADRAVEMAANPRWRSLVRHAEVSDIPVRPAVIAGGRAGGGLSPEVRAAMAAREALAEEL